MKQDLIHKTVDGNDSLGRVNSTNLDVPLSDKIAKMRSNIGINRLYNVLARNHKCICNEVRWEGLSPFSTVANGTTGPLYFDTEIYRGDYVYSDSANGWRFRCQVPGKYHLQCFVEQESGIVAPITGITKLELQIFKNGTKHSIIDVFDNQFGGDVWYMVLNGNDDVTCDHGDIIDVRVKTVGDAWQNTSTQYGWIAMHFTGQCVKQINLVAA